jgi:hypothetical protein
VEAPRTSRSSSDRLDTSMQAGRPSVRIIGLPYLSARLPELPGHMRMLVRPLKTLLLEGRVSARSSREVFFRGPDGCGTRSSYR